jgi:hypothetical protein
MDPVKNFAKKSFLLTIVILLILLGLIIVGFNWEVSAIQTRLAGLTEPVAVNQLTAVISDVQQSIYTVALPIFFGICMAFALLIGFANQRLAGTLKNAFAAAGKPRVEKVVPPKTDRAEKRRRDQRFFLHLIGALQQEGRLLDFFSENLSDYEDAQIGAAVRAIHEDCRQVMHKYIVPGPVLTENEGDAITVAAGFDAMAVKLTGNVTGEPPFSGVVRHRGWRARKNELPDLKDVGDPLVITPAEVEVQ